MIRIIMPQMKQIILKNQDNMQVPLFKNAISQFLFI